MAVRYRMQPYCYILGKQMLQFYAEFAFDD